MKMKKAEGGKWDALEAPAVQLDELDEEVF